MARKFFVCCIWKGDESTYKVKKIVALLNESPVPPPDVVEVVICPSSVCTDLVRGSLRGDFQIAAEIYAPSPAECLGFRKDEVFTWQFFAKELREEGSPWVILGTYQRRVHLKESNTFVGDKVSCILGRGMKVIVCVGETLQQREAGEAMDLIAAQTEAIAERVTNWENVVLAYEPVRTIRNEKVATPSSHVEEVHAGIRNWLHANVNHEVAATTRIIYGGDRSCFVDLKPECAGLVNGENCNELASMPDVDGFLVHGAPLKPDFIDIIMSSEISKNV